ncbi:MAG: hypothetical protein DMF07_03650 [Verrucomicrobia bacterium]|nr:MAG: hypothetical protein DMF07_03650 [Verrucomicrobiota bacterium]
MAITRAILIAEIPGCFFRFAPRATRFLETPRLRPFRLSRCADDRRLPPPLRFECLAKIVRLLI